MSIALTNMPFYCLLWVTFGVILVVIAIFRLAVQVNEQGKDEKQHKEMSHSKQEIEELFNYFLQEEEKKNEDLRALLTKSQNTLAGQQNFNKPQASKTNQSNQKMLDHSVSQIIELYEQGEEAEVIAKKLKKGIGEVKLIISLYTKRI